MLNVSMKNSHASMIISFLCQVGDTKLLSMFVRYKIDDKLGKIIEHRDMNNSAYKLKNKKKYNQTID